MPRPAARPSSRSGFSTSISPSGLRCRAFCSAGGTRRCRAQPRYFNFYLTQSADVLKSAAYIERLDHPTPMTRKIMSEIFKDMIRTVCHRTFRLGAMRGAAAVAVRFTERLDQNRAQGHDRRTDQDKAVACGEIWSAVGRQRISGVRGGAPARRRPQGRGVSLRRDAAGGGRREDCAGHCRSRFPQAAVGVYRLLCEIRPLIRASAPSPP